MKKKRVERRKSLKSEQRDYGEGGVPSRSPKESPIRSLLLLSRMPAAINHRDVCFFLPLFFRTIEFPIIPEIYSWRGLLARLSKAVSHVRASEGARTHSDGSPRASSRS